MAQIIEERITIVISRMAKNGEEDVRSSIGTEALSTIEAVTQELVPEGAIVEIIEG